MKNLETLSDHLLLINAHEMSQKERFYSLALLEHLLEIDNRKLYATLGYDSLFKYVVRELGYSESVAYERIRAMRLVRRVPVARDKIESGELNLSNAAKLESFRRQEGLATDATAQLVEECVGKTGCEVEKHLLSKSKNPIPKDRTRNLTAELKEARIVLTPELQTLILRFEELHGKKPLSEVLKTLLTAHLKKKNPAVRSAETSKRCVKVSPAKERSQEGGNQEERVRQSRYVTAEARRLVWQRSQGRCEWRSRVTGLRCTSRYRLQLDHFPVPYAMGGATAVSNLRHACPAHNARFAVEVFGAQTCGPTKVETTELGCSGGGMG